MGANFPVSGPLQLVQVKQLSCHSLPMASMTSFCMGFEHFAQVGAGGVCTTGGGAGAGVGCLGSVNPVGAELFLP
jgi:hypothetical protein